MCSPYKLKAPTSKLTAIAIAQPTLLNLCGIYNNADPSDAFIIKAQVVHVLNVRKVYYSMVITSSVIHTEI